jgi:hypothetical protein
MMQASSSIGGVAHGGGVINHVGSVNVGKKRQKHLLLQSH